MLEGFHCIPTQSLPVQQSTNIVQRISGIGLGSKYQAILLKRLVKLALRLKRIRPQCQVGEHIGALRIEKQRLIETLLCQRQIAGLVGLAGDHLAKCGIRESKKGGGFIVQCTVVIFLRLGKLSMIHIRNAQTQVGKLSARVHFKHVCEKRSGIFPHFDLRIGFYSARRDHRDRKHQGCGSELRRVGNGIADQPDDGEQNADGGNIGIALGHGLFADLDNADDRRQCSQEPQPAYEAIRAILAEAPTDDRDEKDRNYR